MIIVERGRAPMAYAVCGDRRLGAFIVSIRFTTGMCDPSLTHCDDDKWEADLLLAGRWDLYFWRLKIRLVGH